MAALMVEREIDGGPYGRAPTGPLLNSRACLRILMVEREIPHHRNGEPLPGLSLTVEPLPDLMVEPLPVLSLTVEPAVASLWSSDSVP
jgi:hypothetical protein